MGAGLGEHINIWDRLFISATIEASNFKFVHNLGLGISIPRNSFYEQSWRGSGLGHYPKSLPPPLLISATVEASNFKFSTQLEFGE